MSHDLFNEGVTDKIGEEVFQKYIERTGDRSSFADAEGNISYETGYISATMFVDAFCQKVALHVGVPTETVWNAVKQGYFTGEDLQLEKFQKMFSEVLERATLEDISKTSPSDPDQIKMIIQKIEAIKFTDEEGRALHEVFDKAA